ncbi:MAG: hypothetical protein AAGA56_16380 [Myxococcota bacterium]
MERRPEGFTIHALYRDSTLARLAELASPVLERLRQRGLEHLAQSLERSTDYHERINLARAWPFLLRPGQDLPGLESLGQSSAYWDVLAPSDMPRLRAQSESRGRPRANIEAHHRSVRPHDASILRDRRGVAIGTIQWVTGDEVAPEEWAVDPCLARLQAEGRLAGSCIARHLDVLVEDRDAAPVLAEIIARSAAEALGRPGIARYLVALDDRDVADSYAARNLWSRFSSLDFRVKEYEYWVAGYEFTARSAADWVRASIYPKPTDPLRLVSAAPSPRLSDHVRQALRDFHDDVRLASNPLGAHHEGVASAAAVRSLLRRAWDQLPADSPAPCSRELIQSSYFERHGKQRAIAGDFGLAYSTYRRHLKRAVENLTLHVEGLIANKQGEIH